MTQMLPDAPWIREAERFGMPPYDDDPDPICPCCGREANYIYLKDGEPIGCDLCLDVMDADDWAYEQKERAEE